MTVRAIARGSALAVALAYAAGCSNGGAKSTPPKEQNLQLPSAVGSDSGGKAKAPKPPSGKAD